MACNLTIQKYNSLITKAEDFVIDNPTIRLGQSLWNTFYDEYSEILKPIEGSNNDPYLNNQNIKNFLNYIKEHVRDNN